MRKLVIIIAIFATVIVINQAFAFQEIKDVSIVDVDMNYEDKVCTITIDQDIPTSSSTKNCTPKTFSWKCFTDDYIWHMILHINETKAPIDMRYSSDECFDEKTRNFRLLTVW